MKTLVAALLVAGAALAGCDTPCQALANLVCACEPSPAARQDCEKRVRETLQKTPPTADEQKACDALHAGCQAMVAADGGAGGCASLDTPEGKRACGLAF